MQTLKNKDKTRDYTNFFKTYPNAGKFLVLPNFLSLEACKNILAYSEQNKLMSGTINSTNTIDRKIRNNKVLFLKGDDYPELAWLFDKLRQTVSNFSTSNALPSLLGLQKNSVQLGKYGKEDFYEWHQDSSPIIKRKVTFSIQLTSATDYKGGDLQLHTTEGVFQVTRAVGTLTIFTSSTYHRVSPITEGVRHSLVGWFM